MIRYRFLWPRKYYLVATGKYHKIHGGSRNFVMCHTLSHALAVYKKSKVAVRQIDVHGDVVARRNRRGYAIKWGRK
jgi:hypothetical protein